MTAAEIRLVEESFEQVRPVSGLATQLFLARLYEADPQFSAMLQEQQPTLIQTLFAMVRSLRCQKQFKPLLEATGRRLAGFGMRDQDYVTAGAALLWTLERGLGAAFTEEVRDAWASVYSHVASAMRVSGADIPVRSPARTGMSAPLILT